MNMANTDKIRDNLELILSRPKFELACKGLETLKTDDVLAGKLQSLSDDAVAKQGEYGTILPIINLVETVLGTDYKMEKPTMLSPFMKTAYDGGSSSHYSILDSIIRHFNELEEVAPDLLSKGVVESSKRDTYYIDERGYSTTPYQLKSGQYTTLVHTIWNNDKKSYKTPEALEVFMNHFKKFEEAGIRVNDLREAGYISILEKAYTSSPEDLKKIGDALESVQKAMISLDRKGFDLYNPGTISTLSKFMDSKQIEQFEKVTDYCNPNTLILNFKLRLKV
jgi:hypothetical protein